MPIYETFSKRQKELARAGQPDVYQYDLLPEALRVQIINIWANAIGRYEKPSIYVPNHDSQVNMYWRFIHNTIAIEKGLFYLGDNKKRDYFVRCQQYLLMADVEGALDMIEQTFRLIDTEIRKEERYSSFGTRPHQKADDAIDELNRRFREHDVGYQFVGGKLIRVDSMYIHAEAIRPAIMLLQEGGFTGASDEFQHAHDHFPQRS